MKVTPQEIKKLFQMKPLQDEGGVYRPMYRSREILPAAVIPGRKGDHSLYTAIVYLLNGKCFSRMHRLPTEEIFHFYMGSPVEMLQLHPDGSGSVYRMGHDILNGELVQLEVPRGTWQGTRLIPGGDWALLGTTMAPGFSPCDYEDGDLEALQKAYPAYHDLLEFLAAPAVYE